MRRRDAASPMDRRTFLKQSFAGFAAVAGESQAAAQGRILKPIPPVDPPQSRHIIDMHVHDWFVDEPPLEPEFAPMLNNSRPDGTYQTNATWAQFENDLELVHKACLLHIARSDVGSEGNDRIAGLVKRRPEKLIPFGSVNPQFPDALDEFKRAVEVLGFKGFKLSPIYQSFHPMDPRVVRIYEQAQEWGVPLIFHTATAQASELPLKWANPVLFDDVAHAFPELKIVMAHLGHPWQKECLVMARKHPNVFTELSGNFYRPWFFYQALLFALNWGQTHKILFGSDWPITTPQETIEGLRNVNQFARAGLPEIPEAVIDGIIYRDSLKLLGIEA